MRTETYESCEGTKSTLYTSYQIEQPEIFEQQLHTLRVTLPIGSSVKLKLINERLSLVMLIPTKSLPVRSLKMKGKTIHKHDGISKKWLSTSLKLTDGEQVDLLAYDIHSDEVYSIEKTNNQAYDTYTDITDRLYCFAKELENY